MTAYAVLTDLTIYGLNATALANIPSGQQQNALDAANALVDSYLNSKFKLPLLAWGKDLTQKVCEIASWTLITIRGFDPDDAADSELKIRYDMARAWLQDITQGEITPVVTDSGNNQYGGPNILQSNTTPNSNQASPGGAVVQQVNPDGSMIITGAPRQRGWR